MKIVGRQYKWVNMMVFIIIGALVSACVPTNQSPKKRSSGATSSTNSAATTPATFGRILRDNPVEISGNAAYEPSNNFNSLLRSTLDLVFLTNSQTLLNPCDADGDGFDDVASCYFVLPDRLESPLVNNSKKWAYDANGAEFVQVNVFGHKKKLLDQWFSDGKSYTTNFSLLNTTSLRRDTSLTNFYYSNFAWWFGSTSSLVSWGNCDFINNAFYSPAELALCYGRDEFESKVWFGQDSNIVYHEMGHALTQIMLNTRNKMEGAGVVPYNVALAYSSYDEGGMIGEGVADWFSFYVNGRSHFAEWALGRFLNQSRPLRENDAAHTAAVSESDESRLAYPDYLYYDPNFPELPFEDIHYSGQIISHFLTALTVDIGSECSMTEALAKQTVAGLMHEAFAEMGDLTSKGHMNGHKGYTNLVDNYDLAFEWVRANNPINVRRFAQTLAKKTYQKIGPGNSGINVCGTAYSKDRLERLWDSYGLLLFKTYNINGSSHFNSLGDVPASENSALGYIGSNVSVNPANRLRTVLIDKSAIKLDPTTGAPPAFVFDDRAQLRAVASNLRQGNGVILSEQLDPDLAFNNGNGKISPGEFVGIALNLYNDSNSTMAGVQVLATDWQHVTNAGTLCANQGDNFPASVAEGAAAAGNAECVNSPVFNAAGSNPNTPLDPVCVVQLNEDSATRWVQQDELLDSMDGLTVNDCLGDDPKSCFIRSPKGADVGWISSIEAKRNWGDSLPRDENNQVTIGGHQAVFFEVSPWIAPGTTFVCRMRVRYSNCNDCYHNAAKSNDDFLDNDLATGKAYKVINLQFTVVD